MSQNQREVTFDLPRPHPWPQSAGLVLGVAQTGDGNRSNTMHYDKNKMKLSLFKCLRKEMATTVYESEIGNVKQKPRKASALAGIAGTISYQFFCRP